VIPRKPKGPESTQLSSKKTREVGISVSQFYPISESFKPMKVASTRLGPKQITMKVSKIGLEK